MTRLIAYKRLEITSEVMITIDHERYGRVKAVLSGSRWAYLGKRDLPPAGREDVERELNSIEALVPQWASILTRCNICGEVLREDICVRCHS